MNRNAAKGSELIREFDKTRPRDNFTAESREGMVGFETGRKKKREREGKRQGMRGEVAKKLD